MSVDLDRPTRPSTASNASIPHSLEMDILFGRIAPATRLIEDDLMARFEASRHRIRSAIDTLVKRGLARRETNKGAHVCRYSHSQTLQMHELHIILQDAAVASIRLPVDQTVITAMMILNEAHNTANKRGDLEAVFHINDQFHRTLYSCCDNKELLAALETQGRRTHSIRTNSLKNAEYLAQAQKEHKQIIEVMIEGDHAALVRLCKAHVDRPMQDYIARCEGASET